MKDKDVYTCLMALGFEDIELEYGKWSVQKDTTIITCTGDETYDLTSEQKFTADNLLLNIPGYMGEVK